MCSQHIIAPSSLPPIAHLSPSPMPVFGLAPRAVLSTLWTLSIIISVSQLLLILLLIPPCGSRIPSSQCLLHHYSLPPLPPSLTVSPSRLRHGTPSPSMMMGR